MAVYLQMEILEQIRGFQSDHKIKEKELKKLQPTDTHVRFGAYKEAEGLMWAAKEVGEMINEAWSTHCPKSILDPKQIWLVFDNISSFHML